MITSSSHIDGILPKGPTCRAYAWQIGPFWQDTLDVRTNNHMITILLCVSLQPNHLPGVHCTSLRLNDRFIIWKLNSLRSRS